MKALEARDHETEGHCERVANYAVSIAEAMGLSHDDVEQVRLGALLHDIGKIGLDDDVLRKTGPLTEREWQQIHTHPSTGFEILQGIDFLSGPAQVVVCHHERFDGKGYPLGLAGKEIPLPARIFAVADAFDAMTSDRPYRPAQSFESARREIEKCAGTQFDPDVVAAFLRALPQLTSSIQDAPEKDAGVGEPRAASKPAAKAPRAKRSRVASQAVAKPA